MICKALLFVPPHSSYCFLLKVGWLSSRCSFIWQKNYNFLHLIEKHLCQSVLWRPSLWKSYTVMFYVVGWLWAKFGHLIDKCGVLLVMGNIENEKEEKFHNARPIGRKISSIWLLTQQLCSWLIFSPFIIFLLVINNIISFIWSWFSISLLFFPHVTLLYQVAKMEFSWYVFHYLLTHGHFVSL